VNSETIYDVFRAFYFAWASGLFIIMLYFGVLDIIYTRKCSAVHIYPEQQYWALATFGAVVVYILSIIEIVLQDVMGGWRVFLPVIIFLPASLAVFWGAHRIRNHAKAVRTGSCR